MTRILIALALVTSAAIPSAAEPLTGEAARDLLSGARLRYADGTEQGFAPDGRTLFFARDGSQSLGHWEIRGATYCSVWPPSDHWACYGVEAEGRTVTFVASDGSRTTGTALP